MPGLVPGIHDFLRAPQKRQTWMAGTSQAMTARVDSKASNMACVAPDAQHYSDPAIPACCTIFAHRPISDLTKLCMSSIDGVSIGSR
jgi:hypothetical protein